jgi:hypothetical protein
MKIELSAPLQAKVAAAKASLASPERAAFKEAVAVAEETIKFYHDALPGIFADLNSDFFRSRVHASQIGGQTDAVECLPSLRTHAIELQTAPATPENIAWLLNIFGCALVGQINLRAPLPTL